MQKLSIQGSKQQAYSKLAKSKGQNKTSGATQIPWSALIIKAAQVMFWTETSPQLPAE